MPARSTSVVLLLGITLAASLALAAVDLDEQPKIPPPPPGGKEPLVLFNVNNNGYIDVCGCKTQKVRLGNIARRASFLEQTRVKKSDILLIDGGNLFFTRDDRKKKGPARTQLREKAKLIVEAYNRMGYQAVNLGVYDFSLGFELLLELKETARFPLLCANLIDPSTGELIFDPYVEVEVGGVKFGIIGITLNTLQPHYLDQYGGGTRVTDATEAARKYVAELSDRNDVIVVMSMNEMDYNRQLVQDVPGIDLLLDPRMQLGSTRIWVEKGEYREKIGDTHVLRMDSQGSRLGGLELSIFPASGGSLVDRTDGAEVPAGRSSFGFRRIDIEPHLLEDPEIQTMMESFKKSTRFVKVEELPPLPFKTKYLTESACVACHEEQHAWWKGTAHADAFASLEETGDQWRQDCIGCHTLGYGQAFLTPEDADPYKNVQCESCHGLNPEHLEEPEEHPWPPIREQACLVCHNKRQTGKEFPYASYRRQVACPPDEKSTK